MKRALASLIVAASLVAPVYADLTVKQSTEMKGGMASGKGTVTTYIKGGRMRSDTVVGDKIQTMIFDVDAQKLYMFDSKKKEADVWDMAAFGQEMLKSVDAQSTKASFKPNGQTKPIGGRTAAGYDMEVTMNAAMAGGKDMDMTVTLKGPVWIVKGAPGSADYTRFYKLAAEKGFIFTNPQAAKAQPGQAKAMSEMYKQIADVGGIAYETNIEIKMGGTGPMAGLLGRMGNLTMVSTVESVETGALGDDLFAPPAGYKINIKK